MDHTWSTRWISIWMFTCAQTVTWLCFPYRYGRATRGAMVQARFFTTTTTTNYLRTTASWPHLDIGWHYPDIHGCKEETRDYIHRKCIPMATLPLMYDYKGMVALRVGAGVDAHHHGEGEPHLQTLMFGHFPLIALLTHMCVVFELLFALMCAYVFALIENLVRFRNRLPNSRTGCPIWELDKHVSV